mgnify:CR=1 FL=1
MQLDYKDIIIKHYALSMSGSEIARQTGFSKSGVNDFLRAFKKCEDLQYPLPAGITNYGIAMKVYGSVPGSGGRNENIELPDYEEAANLMATRKNMTLMFLWNRYKKKCEEEGARFYQSRYCVTSLSIGLIIKSPFFKLSNDSTGFLFIVLSPLKYNIILFLFVHIHL